MNRLLILARENTNTHAFFADLQAKYTNNSHVLSAEDAYSLLNKEVAFSMFTPDMKIIEDWSGKEAALPNDMPIFVMKQVTSVREAKTFADTVDYFFDYVVFIEDDGLCHTFF